MWDRPFYVSVMVLACYTYKLLLTINICIYLRSKEYHHELFLPEPRFVVSWTYFLLSKYIHADSPVIVDYSVHRVSSVQQSVNAILTCTADSRPLAAITWFLNGTELNNSTRHQIHHSIFQEDTLRSNTLIIYNISVEDEGNYTCLAATRVGNDSATITFSYSGKPFIIRPKRIYVKWSCNIVEMTDCQVQCCAIDNPKWQMRRVWYCYDCITEEMILQPSYGNYRAMSNYCFDTVDYCVDV